jgi:hypothetical protein
MLASLILASAWAVEPTPVAEPFPIEAPPGAVEVSAYALPVPDEAWITEDVAIFRCTIQVTLSVAGPNGSAARPCPPGMAEAAIAATAAWRFLPAADPAATRFSIDYVLHYQRALAVMTLHAEVDPGEDAAFSGLHGPPGVELVHAARASKEVHPKLPRSAREQVGTRCPVRFTVDGGGRPAAVEVLDCPPTLIDASARAAAKWVFTPRVVDGISEADEVRADVVWR